MPPSAPVIEVIPGDGALSITWTPVIGALSYNVYYDDDAGHPPWDPGTVAAEGAPPVNTTQTRMLLTGLPNGTLHYVAVTAVDGGGEGPLSNEETATPLVCPTITVIRACVDIPKNFRVDDSGASPIPFIRLKWDLVQLADWQETWSKALDGTEDVLDPLTFAKANAVNCKAANGASTVGYRLYRDDFQCDPFVPGSENLIVDETTLTAFIDEYTDLSVFPGVDYRYFIEVVGLVS